MPIFVNDLPDTLTKMGIVADAEDFMNGKQAELVLRYLLQWLIMMYRDQNQLYFLLKKLKNATLKYKTL